MVTMTRNNAIMVIRVKNGRRLFFDIGNIWTVFWTHQMFMKAVMLMIEAMIFYSDYDSDVNDDTASINVDGNNDNTATDNDNSVTNAIVYTDNIDTNDNTVAISHSYRSAVECQILSLFLSSSLSFGHILFTFYGQGFALSPILPTGISM